MGRLFYCMFTAILSVVLFQLMLSFLTPLLNVLEKVPTGILVMFAGIGGDPIYLLWNVFDSIHNKVCEELSKGIIPEETVEHLPVQRPTRGERQLSRSGNRVY